MAYNFNEEDKEVQEFNERIGFGRTKVQFQGAVAETTEQGKDYIEVMVMDSEGVEETARVWFVGGAAKISFNTLRQIIVHNGKDEAEKERLRQLADGAKDTSELADILNNECASGELWFTKYYDPSRTYTAADGSTRRSINKNIYGYEPKLKPELMPQEQKQVDAADYPNDEPFPDAKPVSAADQAKIPDSWSGSN